MQTITSANTSRNMVPALFKADSFRVYHDDHDRVTINLDIGGGKYETATDWLMGRGIINLVWDPYNRSKEHNNNVMRLTWLKTVDTCSLSNVLNVINCKEERYKLMLMAKDKAKVTYITVYEGDGTGEGVITRDGWQENRKLADYRREAQSVFDEVVKIGKVLVCR